MSLLDCGRIGVYLMFFSVKVRQGVTQTKQQTQPGKYVNTELMKVGLVVICCGLTELKRW